MSGAHAQEIHGNKYDKYGSTNPIVTRIMKGFFGRFDELVSLSGARSAYEVGCGEGALAVRLMTQGLDVSGSDVDEICVVKANARAHAAGFDGTFRESSPFDLRPDSIDSDLIVCCEVLEHVDDPESAWDVLCSLGPQNLLLSVPREPIWRILNMLRGEYLRDLGNEMLSRNADVLRVRRPLPWTMALCRPRRSRQI